MNKRGWVRTPNGWRQATLREAADAKMKGLPVHVLDCFSSRKKYDRWRKEQKKAA